MSMRRVQIQHELLDLEILRTRHANMEKYRKDYVDSEKSRDRQSLWADLNVIYLAAQTSHVNPRMVRAKLMRRYPHEFRAHHMFDSYGYPRNAIQIVIAYYVYWRQHELRESQMSTVPYNENTLHAYLHPDEIDPSKALRRGKTLKGSWVHLNPIQRSEFMRKNPITMNSLINTNRFVDDADVQQADQHEREEYNVGNVQKIRAHINITDIFTNERGYIGWLEGNLPGNEAAQEKFREISGWTHKLSPALRNRLIREFKLNTRTTAMDYHEFVERQLRYKDRKADYRPTGTTSFYGIHAENQLDYNIFKDASGTDAFNTLVTETFNKLRETYDNDKSIALHLFDPTHINDTTSVDTFECEVLKNAIHALRNMQPMDNIVSSLTNFGQISTQFVQTHKEDLRKAIIHTMGLYVQVMNDSKLDIVLNHRSREQRMHIQSVLMHQYSEEQHTLLAFIYRETEFHDRLREWYNTINTTS